MVVLLLWCAFIFPAQAQRRRVYNIMPLHNNRLVDLKDGLVRCSDWVGGQLAIADTVEKQREIEDAVKEYRRKTNDVSEIWAMLGGSVTGSKACNRDSYSLPGRCIWCWDYGLGDCGKNNERLIGTGLYPDFKQFRDHYVNFEPRHPYNGLESPYIYYYSGASGWWPEAASAGTHLLCMTYVPV